MSTIPRHGTCSWHWLGLNPTLCIYVCCTVCIYVCISHSITYDFWKYCMLTEPVDYDYLTTCGGPPRADPPATLSVPLYGVAPGRSGRSGRIQNPLEMGLSISHGGTPKRKPLSRNGWWRVSPWLWKPLNLARWLSLAISPMAIAIHLESFWIMFSFTMP